MGVQDCIFCKIVSGQIPATKIYEDEVVVAFLDIGPISDGHTLVMPRQHVEKVHSCPPELQFVLLWRQKHHIQQSLEL